MEKGRRKIRICMAGIVFAAVLVGFLYYYFGRNDQSQTSEGTLVWESGDRQIRQADKGEELQRETAACLTEAGKSRNSRKSKNRSVPVEKALQKQGVKAEEEGAYVCKW